MRVRTNVWAIAAACASLRAEPSIRPLLDRYCAGCHNATVRSGGLSVAAADLPDAPAKPQVWEQVIARLRAESMPPPGSPRPAPAAYRSAAEAIERAIDRAWEARPDTGRGGAVHRLNASEYENTVRDLFGLELDIRSQLPGDETADGSFDNFADSLSFSTAHLERYLSVARQVTRLAVGLPPEAPRVETHRIPLHILQDDRRSEDLPLGSRGGIAVRHQFPADGEYSIGVRLQRQYQDYLKGMGWPQMLDVRLDGKLLRRFTVGGKARGRAAAASYAGDGEPGFAGDPEWERYMQLDGDAGLEVRVPVTAGLHVVSVSFVRQLWEPEGLPQPQQRGRVIANDEVYMGFANVDSIRIGGPFGPAAIAKDTAARRSIFVCQPNHPAEERSCAARIVSRLARLAYRRPVTAADTATLLEFFDSGRRDGGSFDAGIQFALERMLSDPDFLLRVRRSRSGALSSVELASRLSFFLWKSIPDDALLSAAERGALASTEERKRQVRRMLADPRAVRSLVNDFAAQWLNLRRVGEVVVDPLRYPNYDESLLEAFQRETSLFVESTLREDRPVTELISANYTFVNERLAAHYGIPGVYGTRFRRVTLPDRDRRGGLLAHGGLLAATSYPDRTSPVLRGKWLLNNLFGLPVPAPPAGLDTTLETKAGARPATIRERLAAHRKNPSCNGCHSSIDPLGFALENFDAIGGWRTKDESGLPVDSVGTTASGASIDGLAGLRALLLSEPERFPRTFTEKLLAYAIGRRVDSTMQPAVRKIVREAASRGPRWSAIVEGIVGSPVFLTRRSEQP